MAEPSRSPSQIVIKMPASKFPRRAGVVLHPTSLPGEYGIGDLGEGAFAFVDWLAQAGQSYWQVLPLSPTGYGDSPYQGLSAFAGNPLLLSPDKLVEQGLLSASDLENVPAFPQERVDFGWVIPWKTELLRRAFTNFTNQSLPAQRAAFEEFCRAEAHWLNDAVLFLALKEAHNASAWHDWEPELVRREPQALERLKQELAQQIERQKFLQWQFREQWQAVKKYANEHGIDIIGDLPIYVALDCADVWANPQLFHLDENLKPTIVSGVPPDYFSATGQLWGHPIYRWDVMERDGYAWWIARFKSVFSSAEVARIDHFRAFYNYWQVPSNETTAINGEWKYGPREKIFRAVTAALGNVRIIAEDLGQFDAESRIGLNALMHEFAYPGMKVLQFAFAGTPDDPFLPHTYTRDWVVYTGTHDNDTAVGWWQVTSTPEERAYAQRYLRTDGNDIARAMLDSAWSSVADTAMTTAQDILGLGHEARLNLPGTSGPPNWCWRMNAGALTAELAQRLYDLTETFGRLDVQEPIGAEISVK